jgi:hypothetical protein
MGLNFKVVHVACPLNALWEAAVHSSLPPPQRISVLYLNFCLEKYFAEDFPSS